MAHIRQIAPAHGFEYDASPQKSEEWVQARIGKVGSSQLGDWMAVSTTGKPLKARKDLERELAYEMQFNASFNKFVTPAMQAGIDNEDFVADQYAAIKGVEVQKCGMFYNDRFVTSPDRLVGDDGLVEIKWLQDASFADVLESGVPRKHYLQIQGQLWGSGRDWCDYVAANGNTGKLKVIRVEPDLATIEEIKISLEGLDDIKYSFDTEGVFDFTVAPTDVEWS